MFRAVSALSALLLAAAILYTGNGLQFTLLPVRADLENFATPLIGVIMAAYYAGFIAGCRLTPKFIKSVGYIRTFVALASTASASALAHALIVDITAWIILRAISGLCFAGLAMVLESWINERVTNENRGQVLSIYRIVDLLALTVGNALLATASPAEFHLFAFVSILVSLALVPVALTQSVAPKPLVTARLNIKNLFTISPVAAAGVLMVGLANAAFWSVGPIFVQRLNYGPDVIATFMSAVIIGAAITQWPLGWVSDKYDRRIIIAAAGIGAAAAAFGLAEFGGVSRTYLLIFASLLGSVMIPMFGLSVAHANDLAEPGTSVETNGGLLLLHGCGSVAGALLGASLMSIFGPSSLFVYIGGVYIFLSAFCLYRITRRSAVAGAEKTPFAPVPRGAGPTIFEISQDEDETETTGGA